MAIQNKIQPIKQRLNLEFGGSTETNIVNFNQSKLTLFGLKLKLLIQMTYFSKSKKNFMLFRKKHLYSELNSPLNFRDFKNS